MLLTDHRPLTAILGPHTGIPSLAASRLQRWALLLSAHSYDIKYRKADSHCNADGLSRLPLPVTKPETHTADVFYFSQVADAPVSAAQVKRATRSDPVMSAVLEIVLKGHSGSDDSALKPYLARRAELSVQSGCLLWGRRVVIPPSFRKPVLQQLHSGHSGIVRMKEVARSYFWWPGMDGQIEETANSCSSCQKVRNNPQTAPLHPWTFPDEPWYRVHIDFAGPFEDRMFLIAVDAHSKWPEVAIMRSTSTEKTVEKLGEIFSRFGSPVQLVSDNGPQFVSQGMATFLQANGVQHTRSAPYHPATNGLAERFVQTMKHALKASQGQGTLHQRLHRFLLTYRSTPQATTKVSPASLLLQRELRSNFDLLKPTSVKETVSQQQNKQIKQRGQVKVRVFTPGESVLERNYCSGPKWVPAIIIAQTGPVSYTVQTATDIVWRRHVDQLLQTSTPTQLSPEDCADVPPVTSPTCQHAPVQSSSSPEPEVPDSQVTETDTPTPVSTPVSSSPLRDKDIAVPVDRRYPARQRRPPDRLNL